MMQMDQIFLLINKNLMPALYGLAFLCPLFGQKGMLMNEIVKKQMIREIEELRIPELFLAYHPNSHVFSRHYNISHSELKKRTCKMPFRTDEIICMSRFTSEKKSMITGLIADGLLKYFDDIMFWEKHNPFHALEICISFNHPIGEGVVKGTDWNHLFQLSALRIILQISDRKDRLFQITTAYPVPDYDEVDEILDAIDEYQMIRPARRKDV